MTRGSFLLGLVVTVLLTGRVRTQGDDMAQVERAARRFAGLRSYSFRLSYAADGIPLMRTRYVANGRWERGIAHMSTESRSGPVEFYVMNDRTVFRRAEGQWETGAADDQGRDGRRGGAGGASGMGLPGQDLDEVHAKFKSVRRSEQSEVVDSRVCVAYEGDLTARAARAMTQALALPAEGSGAQATARIWIDGDGIIRKYTVAGTPKVLFLGFTFTVRASKTTEIGDIDAVEVRPPAAVMRLLEPDR